MEHTDNIQITGTMSDYLTEQLTSKEQGQAYAAEYLKADFLAAAAISLFTLRREAGLTQAQVAERLHTKQSAIARLEADFDGAISLRRYVDFVLACGFVPHQLTVTPIEAARTFLVAQPSTPLTFENQMKWNSQAFQVAVAPNSPITQPAFCVALSATTLQEAKPKLTGHDMSAAFDYNRATVQKTQHVSGIVESQFPKLVAQERAA
jgi:transcriptional regulator with XRE-family HTH domain